MADVPAFLSPGGAYLEAAADDDYVCIHCERGKCHRCHESACTCCAGVPDNDAA